MYKNGTFVDTSSIGSGTTTRDVSVGPVSCHVLIGHVVGPKLKRSQARILLTALRAESIYFGPRSAVTFNPLADIKNRKQALYISKNGRSIRVNEKILRDPAATKEFLRDIRSTVFKQQVEILASK